jgi:superfamily II DNA or RNA helicase
VSGAICGALLLRPGDANGPRFRRALSLPNPQHLAWKRHGKGKEPAHEVSACGVMDGGPWKGGTWVPRCADGVQGAVRTVAPPAAPLEFLWRLRGYQQAAADAVVEAGGGIVEAPCGAGKTVIGCSLMSRYDTPCLVLVHTRDLAMQWVARIRDSLGIEAGLVGYGKRKKGEPGGDARVVVASLQTLARFGWWAVHEFGLRFGLVIADEAHHVPASTWGAVMAGLSARVRVGLTATPERADGLTPILGWHLGPTVARIDPQVLEDNGSVLAPRIQRWHAPEIDLEGLESHERDRALAEHEARNAGICIEARMLVEGGGRVLLLVKLVDHAYTLAALLCAAGVDAAALVGEIKPAERAELVERMRSGTVEVVVATSLADEGLDAPRLDSLIMAAPSGNLGRVEQRIGRVCRPHEDGLDPVVVDVVDSWGPFQGYARRRAGLYSARGWR